MAGLPACLLCWLCLAVIAVIACLLAAGLPDGLHQHTHFYTLFLYNTCLNTFVYTVFSILFFFYTRFFYTTRFFLYNSTQVISWQQSDALPGVFAHLDSRSWALFFYTSGFRHIFSIQFFYSAFFYTHFSYTTRFFLYSLIQAIFW